MSGTNPAGDIPWWNPQPFWQIPSFPQQPNGITVSTPYFPPPPADPTKTFIFGILELAARLAEAAETPAAAAEAVRTVARVWL